MNLVSSPISIHGQDPLSLMSATQGIHADQLEKWVRNGPHGYGVFHDTVWNPATRSFKIQVSAYLLLEHCFLSYVFFNYY